MAAIKFAVNILNMRHFQYKRTYAKRSKSRYFEVCIVNDTYYLLDKYSSIAFAAVLPAPIAEMTVAAPVTASPPA